jgi:hypothetical protein
MAEMRCAVEGMGYRPTTPDEIQEWAKKSWDGTSKVATLGTPLWNHLGSWGWSYPILMLRKVEVGDGVALDVEVRPFSSHFPKDIRFLIVENRK